MNGNQKESLKHLWLGIVISFGIYLFGVTILLGLIGPAALIVAIAAHFIIIIVSFKKGKKRLGQGLLIGLGLTILLTAACFGFIFTKL